MNIEIKKTGLLFLFSVFSLGFLPGVARGDWPPPPQGDCGQIVGPIRSDIFEWVELKQTPEYGERGDNEGPNALSVTFGSSQQQTWSWNVEGGGSVGMELAQFHFNVEIGHEGAVEYSTNASGQIPGQQTWKCCYRAPEPGSQWETFAMAQKTHVVNWDIAKESASATVRRFEYYYCPYYPDPLALKGEIVPTPQVLGYATLNEKPVKVFKWCATYLLSGPSSCAGAPRDYQYPFELNQVQTRYTPLNAWVAGDIDKLKACSPCDLQRSCIVGSQNM